MTTDYPIKDYAIIGDCRTSALVNSDGGIDWLCLPAFDGPSFFAALLDREKGGTFRIWPRDQDRVERAYLADSAVLQTRFYTKHGILRLTDFFLIARQRQAAFYDFTSLHSTQKLVRILEVEDGEEIPVSLTLEARPNYARSAPSWKFISKDPQVFRCQETDFYTNMPVIESHGDLTANFLARRGQLYFSALDYACQNYAPDEKTVRSWLTQTLAYWEEWNLFNYYRGSYEKVVRRSAVTLKLLTYAPTGAVVAAATTSLPERFGGDQNWDYRYGKIMAWTALRRAWDLGVRTAQVNQVSQKIYNEILGQAVRERQGEKYLSESYETDGVDASLFLSFPKGFADVGLAASTRKEIERRLAKDAFVYRNLQKKDGEREGAFLICSFWLVRHLVKEGRLDRAEALLDKLICSANPLGLYAEEIDPESGEFLGNFPQAFSHLGLISGILDLEHSKKDATYNSLDDHEKFNRAVGATIGVRGVIEGFLRVPETFRLIYSNRSKWGTG